MPVSESLPTSRSVGGIDSKLPMAACLPGMASKPLEDCLITLPGPSGPVTFYTKSNMLTLKTIDWKQICKQS